MLVETLTIAAGRLQFYPGEELELPAKEAQELIDCGAAREVVAEKPEPKRAKPADKRGE